jgi:hypothetical protein
MQERKTSSMLQRVPVILAVTAASYGLQVPAGIGRLGQGISSSAVASQPVGQQRLPAATLPASHQAA